MSIGSKITLGASLTFTASIVYYVHWKQKKDREGLREGVLRDLQRQNMRKTANLKAQQDQIELTKVLREHQALVDIETSKQTNLSTDRLEDR